MRAGGAGAGSSRSIVLGKGLRLFAEGAPPRRMELAESAGLDHGVTHRRYRGAGAPSAGS